MFSIRTLSRRHPASVGCATGILVATALSSAVAVAAIPDGSGRVDACVTQVTGSVRVIDAEGGSACLRTEKPLSWNQTGPAGPAGPSGPPGAPGAPGAGIGRQLLSTTLPGWSGPIRPNDTGSPEVIADLGTITVSTDSFVTVRSHVTGRLKDFTDCWEEDPGAVEAPLEGTRPDGVYLSIGEGPLEPGGEGSAYLGGLGGGLGNNAFETNTYEQLRYLQAGTYPLRLFFVPAQCRFGAGGGSIEFSGGPLLMTTEGA